MAQQVVVRIDPKNFESGLKNVKTMIGATYHAAAKAWTIDVGQVTRETAQSFGLIYGKYGNAEKGNQPPAADNAVKSTYAATHYVGQASMDAADSIF